MQMHPDVVEDPLDAIRLTPEGIIWTRVMRTTGVALRRSIRVLKAMDFDQVKQDALKVRRTKNLRGGAARANTRIYKVREELALYRSARDYFLGPDSSFAEFMPSLGYDVESIRSAIRAMLEDEEVLDVVADLELHTTVRFRAAA